MNATFRNATILAAALFAGTAFAGEATYELPLPAKSALTRAQVQAELAAARAEGTHRVTEVDWPLAPAITLAKSRQQVRDELRIAALNGELASGGEPHGFDGVATPVERRAAAVLLARR
jgi:hypothetical protein